MRINELDRIINFGSFAYVSAGYAPSCSASLKHSSPEETLTRYSLSSFSLFFQSICPKFVFLQKVNTSLSLFPQSIYLRNIVQTVL